MEVVNIHDPKKILIIGDSLESDIKGANNMTMDSLLVLTGIHQEYLYFSDEENNNKKQLICKKQEGFEGL